MEKDYKAIKILTVLCVVGGVATSIIGALNGKSALVVAGMAIAAGLSFAINFIAAIIIAGKSLKKNDSKSQSGANEQNGGLQGERKVKDKKERKFDIDINDPRYTEYMEANDAFEVFLNGDEAEILSAEEYSDMIDEEDALYDKYILDRNIGDGDMERYHLYAQEVYKIIEKYKKIIGIRKEYKEADEAFEQFIDGDETLLLSEKERKALVEAEDDLYEEYISFKKNGDDISGYPLYAQQIYKLIEKYKKIINSKIDNSKIEHVTKKDEKSKNAVEAIEKEKAAKPEETTPPPCEKIAENSENSIFEAPKIEKTAILEKNEKVQTTETSDIATQKTSSEKGIKKPATIGYKGIKKK